MSWKNYKIGDFLTRSKESVKIKQQGDYALVTIKMYHKGVVKRSHVKGSSIKSPTLYKVRAGQFILSGIDARNRAFGIVPDELEGAIVTNDFWTHDIDTSIIDIKFFYWFTTTPQFYEACIKASEGTTNRQRLQADKFYSFDVLLPSIEEQKDWVERISYIQNKYEHLNKELEQQQTYLQLLLQTILQEAIQGKLTKQDPTDEPANDLLKRIKAEKEELVKAGTHKKEKDLPPVIADEIPFFELPERWVWCRLEDISTNIHYGFNASANHSTTEVRLLRITDIQENNVEWEKVPGCIISNKEFKTYELQENDVLIARTGGTIGKSYIVKDLSVKAVFASYLIRIIPAQLINANYLKLFIESPTYWKQLIDLSNGTGQPNVNGTSLKGLFIPLPPLPEQQRIVAKVKQLQEQLGQLEAQVQQSRQYAQQLLQSVLKGVFEEKAKVYEMKEEDESLVAEN